jgi:7-cyano-7-deazaguanine synthase
VVLLSGGLDSATAAAIAGSQGFELYALTVEYGQRHACEIAMAWAESLGARDIVIGVNALDYSGYPDCRPEFIEAFDRLAALATKAGVEGAPLRVHAPLISLTKAEIIRRGLELGVDYGLTHSCYDPDITGRPCGRCDSCRLRARGFAEAGVPDPALLRLRPAIVVLGD